MAQRRGGQIANLNRATNGVKIARLTLGELPATMRRQLQNARKYRRELEQLVVEAHGEVNATQAHYIDEACAAEVHASICRWLLRTRLVVEERVTDPTSKKVVKKVTTMSTGDITKCSEQILKSKTIRNKAVERLKLNVETQPWEAAFDGSIPKEPQSETT